VETLVRCIHLKDGYTGDHCRRVSELALMLAEALLPQDPIFCSLVYIAGTLHDIGKIGIPDHILTKPGRLTAEEMEVVKEHPAAGEELLRDAFVGVPEVLQAVRSHHERWDGGGYPDGLKGEEIPLSARIMAVCDAYDAMTSSRPYRPALSPARALETLAQGAGVQWAPAVVAVFLTIGPAPLRLF
jgi:HD-GYP domain-containing protein (c-di-GMP phosphodiesterase class II)